MKKLIIALSVIVGLSLLAGGGYAYYSYTSTPVQKHTVVLSKYQVGPPEPREMLELVNAERAKHGVPPLSMDVKMSNAAQWKTDNMSANHYFAHKVPGLTTDLDKEHLALEATECISVSENLGMGDRTSKEAIDGWINSPHHHTAMLNPSSSTTGFGVTRNSDGVYITSEHFCTVK